jgi:8-oxo-dGTP pyrophosphatase MutT (NUDIX family)
MRLESSPQSQLLAELADYRSRHPEEASLIDRLALFVAGRGDAFLRSCLEGHVTGSAFIATPSLDRVLFVHHVKLDKWLQPGGHCEEGETAREAAAREALEETGLAPVPWPGLGIFDADIHPIPARGSAPAHFHYDIRYLFTAPMGGERISEESHDIAWLDFPAALGRNGEASIRRPLAKLQALAQKKTKPAG